MTRSAEFTHTVKCGVRAPQSDLVVHAARAASGTAPHIGLIVAKSVGNAVVRHRVARRLRHAARTVLPDLDPMDRIVVRALPSSRDAVSQQLEDQLQSGIRRAHRQLERHR